MKTDWQSWAALIIIAMTMGAFARNFFKGRQRKKNATSCGQNCGCGKKWTEQNFADRKSEQKSDPE